MPEVLRNGPPQRSLLLKLTLNGARYLFSCRGLRLLGVSATCCLALIGIVGTVVVHRMGTSMAAMRANGDLRYLADQVKAFRKEQNRLPTSMAELVVRPADAKEWPVGGYLERLPKDPWGGDYTLLVPGNNPEAFYVVSLGADNLPGGAKSDADLKCPEDWP